MNQLSTIATGQCLETYSGTHKTLANIKKFFSPPKDEVVQERGWMHLGTLDDRAGMVPLNFSRRKRLKSLEGSEVI